MDKIYLLLRNNRQTGPHSHEDLLQLNLKPTDLIWVEGKSAGWRNPMEVDALKSYSPDISQQILNRADKPDAEKIEKAAQYEAIAVTKENPTFQKQSKNIFVSLPAALQITDAIEVQEESLAEKLEKKAQELYNRAQAFSQEEKSIEENDIDIDTKYSRSLNDVKEEYSGWLQQQKKLKRLDNKTFMAAAAIVLIIVISLFRNSFNKDLSKSTVVNNAASIMPKTTEAGQTPVFKNDPLTVQEDYLPDADFFKDQMKSSQDKKVEETSIPILETKVKEAPTKESKQIKEPVQVQPEEKEEKIAVVNKKDDTILQTSTSESEIKKEKPSVPLTQLIDINGDYLPGKKGDGINGYKVTIQNNSDQLLKVVAVDVFYYAANDKLLNKKILYFSNVSPGTNMILTAPANKQAVAASHQLGLVSSEEGAIYFVKH